MKRVLVAAMTTALAGCASLGQHAQVSQAIATQQAAAVQQISALRQPPPPPTVTYLKQQWVDLTPIPLKTATLPTVLRQRLRIKSKMPVDILDVGQVITEHCGIPVRITTDALSAINHPLTPDNVTTGAGPALGDASPARRTDVPAAAPDRVIDINYDGELHDFLDMVSARFGLSWRLEDGHITIYNLDTKTFFLHALATATNMRSDVESGTTLVNGITSNSGAGTGTSATQGGIGGNSSSTQGTTITYKTSIWNDIKEALESMRSVKGRPPAVSPATGTITVTDNAEALARVSHYIHTLNVHLSKQVLFNVKVLSVTTTRNDGYGINWSAVYNTLNHKYGISLASNYSGVQNAVTGQVSVLSTAASPWAGSQAIVSALAEQADVSLLKEPSASILNMQPVAVQVGQQQGFVAGSQLSQTPQVGSLSALQTGMITTGFNMSMIPYVMEDDEMLLQFSINLSSLVGLRTVSVNGSEAELPTMDEPINSTQQVKLKAGDTLMLAGFDQDDRNAQASGIGTPSNWLLGGGQSTTHTRTTLVVLITPVIED